MAVRGERRGLTNGSGPIRPTVSRGRVNGLPGRTNGMRASGKVNGLRRDRGRVNGLVNGSGITNGTGLVNGSGFVNGLPLRKNPFGIVTHRDLRRGMALIVVSLVLLVLLGYLMSEPVPPPAFAAEGDFREWADVPAYADDLEPALPGAVDLRAYALHATAEWIFVYGRTEASPFSGATPASLFVLVDWTDSGYAALPGFRADAVGELYGWDGVLRGTTLRVWTGGGDPDNASAFERLGGFPAAAAGAEFELALERSSLGLPMGDFALVLTTGTDDGSDRSPILGPHGAALVVTQRPLVTTVSAEASVLELTFHALVAPVRVGGITYAQSGGGLVVLPTFPFLILAGGTRIETIRLDPGALPSGRFLTVRVTDVDASAAGRINATMLGDSARVYVDAVPAGKTVDGLFGDWTGTTADGDDAVPDSIDIRESAAAIQAGAFFYLRTEGNVLNGALLPEQRARPSSGGAGGPAAPVPIPRQAGEDVLRVYVDRDDRDTVGSPFGGLIADRLVEVRGRVGRVTQTLAYVWDPAAAGWRSDPAPVDAAFRGVELEGSVPASFLGPTNNATVVFATSDWSGAGDETAPFGLRTRAAPRIGPLHGTNPDTIEAAALTNIPTVDGDCATASDEYDGANTGSETGITFVVGRRSDFMYLYVCIRVGADGTSNAFDWGELVFDTTHDGQNTPQADDRRFRVYSGSTFLIREKGDGTGWVDCDTDCDSGDIGEGAFTGGVEVYEFRIRFSDVWGTNSPTANQRAGFGVIGHDEDGAVDYFWGTDAVDDTDPETWGHLDIPEFPVIGVALGAIVLPFLRRRQVRRHGGARAANV